MSHPLDSPGDLSLVESLVSRQSRATAPPFGRCGAVPLFRADRFAVLFPEL